MFSTQVCGSAQVDLVVTTGTPTEPHTVDAPVAVALGDAMLEESAATDADQAELSYYAEAAVPSLEALEEANPKC